MSEVAKNIERQAPLWTEKQQWIAGIIRSSIERKEPLQIVLPGFPCKSPDTVRKVLGALPDLAEEAALRHLKKWSEAINCLHPFGAQLVIISDGRFLADLLGVPDQVVTEYSQELRRIATSIGANFEWLSLEDLTSETDPARMRNELMRSFGSSVLATRSRILADPATLELFKQFTRIMEEEALCIQGISFDQRQRIAEDRALEVLRRSDAYSKLIARIFPEALRISIHSHPKRLDKLGINLVPSSLADRTPWHSVAVVSRNGKVELMDLSSAEYFHLVPIKRDGRVVGFKG